MKTFFERKVKGALLLKCCCVVTPEAVLRDTRVLIKDGAIAVLGHVENADARVIELPGYTMMPGGIDAHVHLCLNGTGDACTRGEALNRALMRGLRENLDHGVTAVRDLGSPIDMLGMMGALGAHEDAPCVAASGPVFTVQGGHGLAFGQIADFVRLEQQIGAVQKEGAGWLKLMASGGRLTPESNPHECQFTSEQVRLITRLAHSRGLRVACHAHPDSAVRQCLDAGADTIEHGSYMAQDTARALSSSGSYWVPTLGAGFMIPNLPPDALERVRLRQENLRRVDAGRILCGTDAGIGGMPHGTLQRELDVLCTDRLSMAKMLRRTALALGWERKGEIAVGMDADLALYAPGEADMPRLVIKGGAVVRDRTACV